MALLTQRMNNLIGGISNGIKGVKSVFAKKKANPNTPDLVANIPNSFNEKRRQLEEIDRLTK